MPFPYKTALVTGATSGIGRALVDRMVANGIFVVAIGRRQDRLDALLADHGSDKVAIENADVSDLARLPAWAKRVTAAYPALDCIVLNAGFQQSLDFANPASIALDDVTAEITVNYLSPMHTAALFIPHLTSLGPDRPGAIVFVTSGLALVPIPLVPNYCASKAALHSAAWTLRSQLSFSPATQHLRVIEIIPPAVQTELHTRQGRSATGLPLAAFIDEMWAGLTADEVHDELLPEVLRQTAGTVDDVKRVAYKQREAFFRPKAPAAKERPRTENSQGTAKPDTQ